MNPLDVLKQEHEEILREILELETILESEIINYPNLVHVFRNLCEIWDKHEKKEEKFFPVLKKEDIIIPVKIMLFEHKELRPSRQKIVKAINSGSEFKLRQVLKDEARFIINKLRKHIDDEDEVLYTLTLAIFTSDELEEMWRAVN